MARGFKVSLNNPKLLEWARSSAGYQVEDIAEYLGKSVADIQAWEAGADAPTYCQLRAFAKKVRRPVAALFLPEVPEEPAPPEDFRLLPAAERGRFEPSALLAFRELRGNMEELRTLADELGHRLGLTLPSWPNMETSVSVRAAELRRELGVPLEAQMAWTGEHHALDSWREILFHRGVLVQVFPVPVDELRAFSVLGSGLGGVGVSSKDAPVARIFSLFHEVCHLCLRRPGVSAEPAREGRRTRAAAIEAYCERFAAAFLLPPEHPLVAEAIRALAGRLSYDTARHWASRFQVSKYTIARLLFDLGRVSPEAYWGARDAWLRIDAEHAAARRAKEEARKQRGGPNAVTVRVSHVGKRYVVTVMEALRRGILSRHDAAYVLKLPAHSLADAEAMAGSASWVGD